MNVHHTWVLLKQHLEHECLKNVIAGKAKLNQLQLVEGSTGVNMPKIYHSSIIYKIIWLCSYNCLLPFIIFYFMKIYFAALSIVVMEQHDDISILCQYYYFQVFTYKPSLSKLYFKVQTDLFE